MTRAELQTIVETNVGRTDRTTTIQNGLNLGIRRYTTRHPFQELITLSSVTGSVSGVSIAIPSNTWRVIDLRVIDGTSSYRIPLINWREAMFKFPNVSACSSGKPTVGWVRDAIYFDVPLSSAYVFSVLTWRYQGSYTGDSDSCLVSKLDEALVGYATSFAFRSLQLYTDSDQWLRLAEESYRQAYLSDASIVGQDLVFGWSADQGPISSSPQLDPLLERN